MDILEDKYLPSETATELAYRVKPKYIFKLCYTNTFMGNLCASEIFWRNYINSNQNKWYKILMVATKQADYHMFKYLWSISHNIGIVVENKVLYAAFTEAVKRGYDKFSNWLYLQYARWKLSFPYQSQSYYTDKKRDKQKNFILMIEAAKVGDVEVFRNLNKNNRSDYNANRAINYAPNFEVYRQLFTITYHYMNRVVSSNDLIDLFPSTLFNGNINLANDFLYEIGKSQLNNAANEEYIYKAGFSKIRQENFNEILRSDNDLAFEYLNDNGINIYRILQEYKYRIGSWYTMKKYLQYEVPFENFKEVILRSYAAFSFHQQDYINIINKKLKCLSRFEYQELLYTLRESGEDYIAYLIINNVEICENND